MLHEEVSALCPPDTPIPSIQWLRFQFWPQTSAQTFTHTGKLRVKYMIQARQMRLFHIDAHYVSACFRYQKDFAWTFQEFATFVSSDDKHTVKIGEPGLPVAAVERGKEVICSMDRKFAVADHDFTKFSFSPSVHFIIDIPENIDWSFYTGVVNVGLKENAFQASSAPQHATELSSILKNVETKPLLLLYTDGGPDHNPTFIRTQLSLIALFLAHDLDLLCAVRFLEKPC